MKRRSTNKVSLEAKVSKKSTRKELHAEESEDVLSSDDLPEMVSCLTEALTPLVSKSSALSTPSVQSIPVLARSNSAVLSRSLSMKALDDDCWLSSSLIDLVFSKFGREYSQVHYLSVDFVVLALSSGRASKEDLMSHTDINGRSIEYSDPSRPIVFIWNAQGIHWNLFRVQRFPEPELQLFEPMGRPANRRGGLTFRTVPREVIYWLDTCCPLDGVSWLSVGRSVIITQQQFTPYDCGVACLLYAEKCGKGEVFLARLLCL